MKAKDDKNIKLILIKLYLHFKNINIKFNRINIAY